MLSRALALALLLLAAGCVAPAATPDAPPPQGAAPEAAPAELSWPPIEEATVRPGVQLRSEDGQCTSNFVFVDERDGSVLLGSAAHCYEGLPLGTEVDLNNGAATGTLAYSSWDVMGMTVTRTGGSGLLVDRSCANETDTEICRWNDFALVRVDDEDRGLVHPAMLRFGGPSALADSAATKIGDKVISYGHSGFRARTDPTNWKEGYVTEKDGAWSTLHTTVTPGIPGDSGSAVLTGDGRALAVLVSLRGAPSSNGAGNLDLMLEYAREHADMRVALATWELLDAGLLPSPPRP